MPYDGMHSAQFIGLINAVRTGDPTVDMIAAFLLPFIVQKAMTGLPREIKKLMRYLLGKHKIPVRRYKRNIIYRMTQDSNGGMRMTNNENNSYNMYLLRAIQLYVNKHCQLKDLEDAHLDLTRINSRCQNNRHGGSQNNSTVDLLQSCSLVEKPLENVWLDVGTHGGGNVHIMMCDSSETQGHKNNGGQDGGGSPSGQGGSNGESSTRSVEIKMESSKSVECLHAFVNNAFDWYVKEIRRADNKDRYMLDVQPMDFRNNNVPQYVAYKMGDEKTFATLFNRKCHELLRIVDHFENKTGKYAIKGYPYKLGLLLTGIPGTGKSSLIKALAHRTGRHIVNINLAHIESNGNLRKIFFNRLYQTTGATDHQMRLDFDQVIFVLEDVDAAAKEVVMDRDLLAQMEAERSKESEKPEEGPMTPLQRARHGHRSQAMAGVDRLNLSGLLNVLDGVVETPGRMVIMTTNHPEILDPALIRPGRIDRILELGYMKEPEDVIAMLEHYYPKRPLTAEERALVEKCIVDDEIKITPAQMEQLAMEAERLSAFLDHLCCYGKEENTNTTKPKDRLPPNFFVEASTSNLSTWATEETWSEGGVLQGEDLLEFLLDGGDY